MEYDYLVIASGATTNYFGTKGAEENSRAIYTRAQALKLRDEIFTNLEHAAASNTSEDLAIVVVGAGPTGVEMAGALAELRNDAMASIYPELDPRRTHIVLVEMADKVLAPFAPTLREFAAKALRERGVELRLNTSVAEVRPDGVVLGGGEFLKAGVVIWATGVAVPKVVGTWGLPQGRGGRITVDADLRVSGFKNIFAVGDVAIYPEALPQLAQPALQGGKHAGKQIAALVTGRPTHDVPLPRQGHHGHGRPPGGHRGHRADQGQDAQADRHAGLAGLAVRAHRDAAGQPEPAGDAGEPVDQVPGAVPPDESDRR